ncbi:MAG TPA: type II toxin-antitoxin system HicB family antitoxin [Lacunisphaera sp.]|nr:type II toxin-antitoxin system HicB family antitoxin [Lacunisphaera sp.]
MKTTIKDYAVTLYWDERAGYFVAEIPEIPTCAADGPTQGEALANLQETFAVLKETYQEEGLELPVPNPELPFSVVQLSALADVVKVSRLAELAGIPGQTLATKLKRGTEFTLGESRRLADALSSFADIIVTAHHGHWWAEAKSPAAGKPTKSERPWVASDVKKLAHFVEQNTPTRVIGFKLGRSERSVYKAASEHGISLKPANSDRLVGRGSPKQASRVSSLHSRNG